MQDPKESSGVPCGLFRRLAIIFYDSAVVLALLMLASWLALLAGLGPRTALKDPGYTLFLSLICYFYLAWCWHRGGMTVGMRAWRVSIVDDLGNRPGWGKVTVRFLAALLSTAALGLGFLWALFDPGKRTWHDILSHTRLVRF
ncbi:RDD family protein [Pseudomonadota bacterium]